MTNMASTRPEHTTGTATCSWSESTYITTKLQVNPILLTVLTYAVRLSHAYRSQSNSIPDDSVVSTVATLYRRCWPVRGVSLEFTG